MRFTETKQYQDILNEGVQRIETLKKEYECHCGKDGHALNSINCPVHGKKSKMTRNEALSKIKPFRWYGEDGQNGWFLDNLEALGLIKFEEENKTDQLFEWFNDNLGVVRLERWSEGLVLWVGGRIVYESWK